MSQLQTPTSGVFRSEKMVLCQIFFQSNVAFENTCNLGELGIVEFRDLNGDLNAYQRKYVDEIRQIGELQRRLVYLHKELVKEEIEIQQPDTEITVPRYKEIIQIQNLIEEMDHEVRQVTQQLDTMRQREFQLKEVNMILSKTSKLLETTRRQRNSSLIGLPGDFGMPEGFDDPSATAIQMTRTSGVPDFNKIYTVCGLIRSDRSLSFRKIIWRVCGQNALVQFYDVESPIDDVTTNELVQKKVYLIMCQGDKLYEKIKKICDGFRASQYPLPEDDEHYRRMCADVEEELKTLSLVIKKTREQKTRTLMILAEKQHFQTWVNQIIKLRAVFTTMNMFRKTEKGFLAECWCAESDYFRLQKVMTDVELKTGFNGQALVEKVHHNRTPPTYFRSNKFTKGFQNIVDSYGVATYGEMNPAPYTVITFPFLFAIMFADAGHGLLMLLFALWMVLCEKRLQGKSNNEIWLTFFDGRYIILLMGAFSIYTGTIYNDIFAKGYNLFGTKFETGPYIGNGTIVKPAIFLKKGTANYPYGIDPAWLLSENKIVFLNSFKMKLSVVLGVLQMLFGVTLSLCNHINARNMISILFEFIPQVIFLLALFGYLILLIFIKWFTVFIPDKAPSILIDFINMFLNKHYDPSKDPPYLQPWFAGKEIIQMFLLVLALIQVPLMLLVKPAILVSRRKRRMRSPTTGNGNIESSRQQLTTTSEEQNHSGHDNDSTGDIFIHQAIHTIEYCLGSVSHTASYLRLWALSLAHSQLSEVLWSMVMRQGFAAVNVGNVYIRAVMTVVTFSGWAVLTVAILIVMEGLSAFLHALRLHWVEFQSKFYEGNGYQFKPFHLKRVIIETNILNE